MTAFSELRDRGVAMMQTARFPIPGVRRAAAVESIKLAKSSEELVDIFLEILTGSPYLADEQKTVLVNFVLQQQWDLLATRAGCDLSTERIRRNSLPLIQYEAFRGMVLKIFRESRRFSILPLDRKRELGGSILACPDKDALMDLFFKGLTTSIALDPETKVKVANDVVEGRFYRLLLPDHLDCDVHARQHSLEPSAPHQEEDEECAICLEALSTRVQTQLPCNHSFCAACIEGWWEAFHARNCPLCRQEVPPSSSSPSVGARATNTPQPNNDVQHARPRRSIRRFLPI